MKAWKLLFAGAACLTLSACRADPNIVLLERELRLHEDEIYRLQDCIAQCEAEVESSRRENAGLRRRLEHQSAREFDYPERSPPSRSAPLPVPLSPGHLVPEAVPLPKIIIPNEASSRGRPAPRAEHRVVDRAPHDAAPNDGPSDGPAESPPASLAPEVVAGTSDQVAHIALNPMLTGGFKQPGSQTHDGVLVVVEPRDQRGRIVAAPADLSVVVVDPAIEGEGGRIARWDFAARETEPLFHAKGIGRGLQVELPWPGAPPRHNDLHLFVRYVTADGRKLQADKPIKVQLAGDPSPPALPRRGPADDRPAVAERRGLQPYAPSADEMTPPATAAQPVEASPLIANNADTLAEPPQETPLQEQPSAASPYTPPKPAGPKRPVWSPERR